ncbi:hydantoinase/oxoprolinase N-terminal domain-containing protein [Saccharopolyspora pogona]|uniref:hydantoinase/oxoprolinase N-terminal domain-containing protein n=1 Tax=Saccharopolyspora pogona TaxID=333966 RepID=UPI0021E0CB09|nr:hydantoinase/oxoprolinase N-terminal domain-containing protein [Saccharopolyspora pogona]
MLRLLPHGSTTATNAVLKRKIARTAFVTIDGFTDVLQIARQNRPALYDLSATKLEPLARRTAVLRNSREPFARRPREHYGTQHEEGAFDDETQHPQWFEPVPDVVAVIRQARSP